MPLATDVDITPAGQRPDEDPSLAVRNNGGAEPAAVPAPAGRREALLVLGFGGPEGPDDVMPFLENVTRGRGIPRERLLDVAEHYMHFGGVSPINEQNKALIAAVEKELAAEGVDLPVYWGNRNWAPYVEDTWAQMAADGTVPPLLRAASDGSSSGRWPGFRSTVARGTDSLPGMVAGRMRSHGDGLTHRRRHTPTAWKPPSTWTISPVVAGNQSESSATTALPAGSVSVTDHPSGARASQASSNWALPGMDFIAMLRSGPAATRLTRTPSGPSSRAR